MSSSDDLESSLWLLHTARRPGEVKGVNLSPSLTNLSSGQKEVERKYELRKKGVAGRTLFSEAVVLVGSKLEKIGVVSQSICVPFNGIDMYWILRGHDGQERIVRYRAGSERPPELTTKYQLRRGSNEIRGEINLDVSATSPNTVRLHVALMADLAKSCKSFAIKQQGNIWKIPNAYGPGDIEIVAYRVERFLPTVQEGVFIEIEAIGCVSDEQALSAVSKYEALFGLKGKECPRSIAELFRPKS